MMILAVTLIINFLIQFAVICMICRDGIHNNDIGQEAEQTHRCGVMLMADGMWKPTNPDSEENPWMTGATRVVCGLCGV